MALDIQTLAIVRKANRLANDLCTRDPHRIAQELGIEGIPLAFKKQRGAYKVLMRNRFSFIKDDLHPVMERIVRLHEIGHDALHREEAVKAGGFKEFHIFDMRPVSYTHLDVYKRQKERRTGRPKYDAVTLLQVILFAFMEHGYVSVRTIEKLCKTCLLYTSRCV